MRRAVNLWATGIGALFACGAFGACTYDFDTLVAPPGAGGTAGIGGAGGAAGASGSSGAAGTEDDGSTGAGGMAPDGSAGAGGNAGMGGTSGTGGNGGTGGTGAGADAGKDAGAGKGGTSGADAGADRIADVRADVPFDCTAMGGTTFQGHCYYPSPTPTNWDTANTTGCASPSHLAVVTSQPEQNVVAGILANTQRWIGLRKDPGSPNMESSLHWVTAETLGYRTWETYDTGTPEPNFTGDCVRMQPSGRWGDTNCAEMYAAVCERE